MPHKPNCPVSVLVYNGNLIVAAGQKYAAVAARLPANYLADTAALIGKMPADIAGQKNARGEGGNLTADQQAKLVQLLHCMSQARKTARLALPGQTVKLNQEFPPDNRDDRSLAAELGRADLILASVTSNLAALKLKGWTDADTTAFGALRGTFPASTTAKASDASDAMKATGVKDTDATDLNEHLLTVQNAADLEYPATNPANAAIRVEFRLGIFPPDHHTAPTPTPTPTTTPTK